MVLHPAQRVGQRRMRELVRFQQATVYFKFIRRRQGRQEGQILCGQAVDRGQYLAALARHHGARSAEGFVARDAPTQCLALNPLGHVTGAQFVIGLKDQLYHRRGHPTRPCHDHHGGILPGAELGRASGRARQGRRLLQDQRLALVGACPVERPGLLGGPAGQALQVLDLTLVLGLALPVQRLRQRSRDFLRCHHRHQFPQILRPLACQKGSRSRRLKIFPLSSRGSFAWKSTRRGSLYLARRSAR